jgi:site-specific recombinase XerD
MSHQGYANREEGNRRQMSALSVAPHLGKPQQIRRQAMSFMTYEELLTVLKVARQRRTRDWCMLLVAYRHGLRTTEVCGLKLSDLKDGVLSVQRLKGSRRTAQPLYPHDGEPLLDEVKALREWLRVRPNDGSDALFTSQKGGALDRCQFFRIFQSVAKAAGLSAGKRHPRVLKYSLASHLLAANADVTAVSEILGHRSLNSTLQYVKAAADAANETLSQPLRHRGIAHIPTTTQSNILVNIC